MPVTPLTDEEIQKVKNYMGYGSMTALALPYLEWAPIFELVVQKNLNDFGITYIRSTILVNLAKIDTVLDPTGTTAQAFGIKELVGDVVFDTDPKGRALTQVQDLRDYWIERLSETVRIPRAVPLNPGMTSEVY
jgi:hypothetical protein